MRRVTDRTLAGVLAERWHAEALAAGPKPTALNTRFRHSDALGCERAIALTALGVPKQDMDEVSHWVTGLGTKIHEWWQDAVLQVIDGGEIEVKVQSFKDGSGHVDLLITDANGYVIAYELKSGGGTKFRQVAKKGPTASNVAQDALNGYGANADEIRIGYIATEAIGLNKGYHGLDRMTAEYVLSRAEYEPVALKEIARVSNIMADVDAGIVPDRLFPDDTRPGWPAKRVDPHTAVWPCQYCQHRDTCIRLGAGPQSVDKLKENASV